MEVLVLDVLQETWVVLLVPSEPALTFQGGANGHDHIGQQVSITLHAEHHVKGDLESNRGNSQRLKVVNVLRDWLVIGASLAPLHLAEVVFNLLDNARERGGDTCCSVHTR